MLAAGTLTALVTLLFVRGIWSQKSTKAGDSEVVFAYEGINA